MLEEKCTLCVHEAYSAMERQRPPSYCQFLKPAKSTDYLIIGLGGGGGGG